MLKKNKHKLNLNIKSIAKKIYGKEKMVNRLANFLEMPEELVGENTKITFIDNKYIYLEGVNHIVDYYDHYIKIKTKKHIISLDGKHMEIKEIGESELCIEGVILNISFEGRG